MYELLMTEAANSLSNCNLYQNKESRIPEQGLRQDFKDICHLVGKMKAKFCAENWYLQFLFKPCSGSVVSQMLLAINSGTPFHWHTSEVMPVTSSVSSSP